MTRLSELNPFERRKKILITNCILSYIGYFISLIFMIIAKVTGLSEISYRAISLILFFTILGIAIVNVIIIKKNQINEKFAFLVGLIQLIVWLAFFGTSTVYIGNIRYCGLILSFMAFIFQVTTFSFLQSVIFTFITTLLYLIASACGIYILDQEGSFWREIYTIACFLPSSILVIIVTKNFNQQRAEVKEAKRISEKALQKLMYEIQLAQKIQQKIIPKDIREEFISSLYQPMAQVGGDFFDFIRFRDSDNIGIFLSDVSGHGVPAAFITSMIKTIILQADIKKLNPSEMLHYVNDILMDQTAGNFITAFYGIYNPVERSIIYSNAGHCEPYIIKEEVNTLKKGGEMALGIFSNHLQEKFNKTYVNYEQKLVVGSKILFYTDGLTETRPIDGGDFFEDSHMIDVFIQNKNLSSNEFIRNLYQELVNFRKREDFDDDICLICLDVL